MELFGFWLLCGMVSAVIAVKQGEQRLRLVHPRTTIGANWTGPQSRSARQAPAIGGKTPPQRGIPALSSMCLSWSAPRR